MASLEWFMFPPFLQICVLHKHEIDLTKWAQPPYEDVDRILTYSYDKIVECNFKHMRLFFENLIGMLKEYQKV